VRERVSEWVYVCVSVSVRGSEQVRVCGCRVLQLFVRRERERTIQEAGGVDLAISSDGPRFTGGGFNLSSSKA
jgi:hypothetical protein